MKRVLIFFLIAVVVAMVLPSFADQVSKSFTENKHSASEKTGLNSRDFGGLNNTFNATDTNVVTTNTALTSAQIKTLKNTQSKLTSLISKISGLKSKYANTKSKGLLNALDQFEKQANKLNSEINAFIQNPNGDINGRINSFVQQEAALEHKVTIKEELLKKMDTKGTIQTNNNQEDSNDNKNTSIKEQNTKSNKKIKKTNK